MQNPPFTIASGLILLAAFIDIGIVLLIAFHGFDKDGYAIVGGILGAWHIALAGAWGFWLGSSAGSLEKNRAISDMVRKLPENSTSKP